MTAILFGGEWDGKEVTVPPEVQNIEVPFLNLYADINDPNPVRMICYSLIDGKWVKQ